MALRRVLDRVVHQGRFLRLLHRQVEDREGRPYTWELVERTTQGPVVVVVPVTEAGEVWISRIWRVPVDGYVTEFVAGLRGPDEPLEETARRELMEEAGCTVDTLEELLRGPYDAGLIGEEIVYLLGLGARQIRPPEREPVEDMELYLVPLRDLPAWLAAPPGGARVDPKCWAALWFLQQHPALSRFFAPQPAR